MTTANDPRQVVVIGGGIAGLSATWYIIKEARAAGTPVKCTVLERSNRWGGKILTESVVAEGGEYVVEAGPDSFIASKPWATQLARELGIGESIIGTNDARRKTYVVNRGRPTPLPDGVLLIVPTKFMPFALSPLISPLGKLRMGMDLFIPGRKDGKDETLAEFVKRRLGSEALDKIAEPLLSGIYNAEADRQSLLATFPRFRALEEQHGSLTRGILAGRRNGHGKAKAGADHAAAKRSEDAKREGTKSRPSSMFLSLKAGSQELIEGLVTQLGEVADLRLGATVTGLEQRDGQTIVRLEGGEMLLADAVVLAAPAFVAADLLRKMAPEPAKTIDGIRYVGTGTVSLAYRAEEFAAVKAQGFGVVVPRSEKRPINAITYSSIKFDHRAPDGYVLLRVFFGGSRSPQSMELNDEALLATVKNELATLLDLRVEPLFHRIYRWPRSNPQYDVNHLDRVDEIERGLPSGLYVTGSPYRGVGLPDCVKQSQELAKVVVGHLE